MSALTRVVCWPGIVPKNASLGKKRGRTPYATKARQSQSVAGEAKGVRLTAAGGMRDPWLRDRINECLRAAFADLRHEPGRPSLAESWRASPCALLLQASRDEDTHVAVIEALEARIRDAVGTGTATDTFLLLQLWQALASTYTARHLFESGSLVGLLSGLAVRSWPGTSRHLGPWLKKRIGRCQLALMPPFEDDPTLIGSEFVEECYNELLKCLQPKLLKSDVGPNSQAKLQGYLNKLVCHAVIDHARRIFGRGKADWLVETNRNYVGQRPLPEHRAVIVRSSSDDDHYSSDSGPSVEDSVIARDLVRKAIISARREESNARKKDTQGRDDCFLQVHCAVQMHFYERSKEQLYEQLARDRHFSAHLKVDGKNVDLSTVTTWATRGRRRIERHARLLAKGGRGGGK